MTSRGISRRSSLDTSNLSSMNSKSFGATGGGKATRRKTFNAIPDLQEDSFLTEESSYVSSVNDENDESVLNSSHGNTSEYSIPARPSIGGGSKRRWSHRSTEKSPNGMNSPMQLRSADASRISSEAKSVSSMSEISRRSSTRRSSNGQNLSALEPLSVSKTDASSGSINRSRSNSSVSSKLSAARNIAAKLDTRRKTFDGGQEALNMLLNTSDNSEFNVQGDNRNRRATVDPSDLDEMMKELENDDSDSMRLSVSSGALTRSSISSSTKSSMMKSPAGKSPLPKKSRSTSTPKLNATESSAKISSSTQDGASEEQLSSSPTTPSAPKSAPTSVRRSPRFAKAMSSLSRSSSGASLASLRDSDDSHHLMDVEKRRATVDAADIQEMLGDLSTEQDSEGNSSSYIEATLPPGSINASTCSNLSFLSSTSSTSDQLSIQANVQNHSSKEASEMNAAEISSEDNSPVQRGDARRETADPDVMKMLLQDVTGTFTGGKNDSKNISASSASPDNTICAANISFGSSNDDLSRRESLDINSLIRVSTTLNEEGLTPANRSSKPRNDKDDADDVTEDDETVEAAEKDALLNDTISTEQSSCTIGTEILDIVQANLEAEELRRAEIMDDEELTTGSIAGLADLLAEVQGLSAPATTTTMQSPRRSRRLSESVASPGVMCCGSAGPFPRKCLICDNSDMYPVRHSPASRKSPRKSPYRSPSRGKSTQKSRSYSSPKALQYNESAVGKPVEVDEDCAAMPPPTALPSALKSCLSQKKPHRTRLAVSMEKPRPRNVVFGSPQAAEFNHSSPTTSFTPLDKAKTNSLFSMSAPVPRNGIQAVSMDPVTQENDRIMNEWERLTNASDCGSDEEQENSNSDEYVIDIEAEQGDPTYSSPAPSRTPSQRRPQKSSERRRRSGLQPLIEYAASPSSSNASSSIVSASPPGIDARDYDPSFDGSQSSFSQESSAIVKESGVSDTSMFSEATHTVSLAGNLLEVVEQNYRQISQHDDEIPTQIDQTNMSQQTETSVVDHTEEIETDLLTLMNNVAPQSSSEDGIAIEFSVNDADCSEEEGNCSLAEIAHRRMSSDSSESGDRTMSIIEDPEHVASLMEKDSPAELGGLIAGTNSFNSGNAYSSERLKSMDTSEDVTYALEGSLAALVNNIVAQDESNVNDQEEVQQVTSPASVDDAMVDSVVSMEVDEDDQEEVGELSYIVPTGSPHGEVHPDTDTDSAVDDFSPQSTSIQGQLEHQQSALQDVADMADSLCDTSDIVHVPLHDTSGLMERIKVLNADARTNTLSQRAVPSERMSIGMQRLSMGGNNTQTFDQNASQRKSKRLSGAAGRLKSALAAGSGVAPRPSTRRSSRFSVDSPLNERNSSSLLDKSCISETDTVTKAYGLASNKSRVSFMLNPLIDEADKENHSDIIAADESMTEESMRRMQIQLQLFEFFNLLQTIKTILSTKKEETKSKVQDVIMENIRSAYIDSVVSMLPSNALLPIWDMSATMAESFVQQTMVENHDVIEVAPIIAKEDQSTCPEQLLLNMAAVAIHGLVTESIESESALNKDSSQDRFFSKVLSHEVEPLRNSDVSTTTLANDAAAADQRLRELRLELDVMNKLTYCRITTFKSTCISINAILSPSINATLAFNIEKSTDKALKKPILTLHDTQVDLVVIDNSAENAQQQAAVSAYFANVMCSDIKDGPLSATSLHQVEAPSQIPDLLHKINGSIAALRLTLKQLKELESKGWRYTFNMKEQEIMLVFQNHGVVHSIPYIRFISQAATSLNDATSLLH